jgi:hypothetical protein
MQRVSSAPTYEDRTHLIFTWAACGLLKLREFRALLKEARRYRGDEDPEITMG